MSNATALKGYREIHRVKTKTGGTGGLAEDNPETLLVVRRLGSWNEPDFEF
jgi:hypothetical protein